MRAYLDISNIKLPEICQALFLMLHAKHNKSKQAMTV